MRSIYRWDADTNSFIEIKRDMREAKSAYVMVDDIKPTYCHSDGKWHTSRKSLTAARIKAGTIVTKLHEATTLEQREDDYSTLEKDIGQARNDLAWGMAELTDEERHICKELNEQFRRR